MDFLQSTDKNKLFTISDGEIVLDKDKSSCYTNKFSSEEWDMLFGGNNNKNGEKKNFLSIMPSYINVIKGRILYNDKTKLVMEKIVPENTPVTVGIIIDLNKVKQVFDKPVSDKKTIMEFLTHYDATPFFFNDERNIGNVYKTRKNTFFNSMSKLCFVTVELTKNLVFYREVPTSDVKIDFVSVDKVIKEKNRLVAHHIYEDDFFIVSSPSTNIKIKKCELINFDDDKIDFVPTTDFVYESNGRQLSIKEVCRAVDQAKSSLTPFSS